MRNAGVGIVSTSCAHEKGLRTPALEIPNPTRRFRLPKNPIRYFSFLGNGMIPLTLEPMAQSHVGLVDDPAMPIWCRRAGEGNRGASTNEQTPRGGCCRFHSIPGEDFTDTCRYRATAGLQQAFSTHVETSEPRAVWCRISPRKGTSRPSAAQWHHSQVGTVILNRASQYVEHDAPIVKCRRHREETRRGWGK
jgi:hypothetical protein